MTWNPEAWERHLDVKCAAKVLENTFLLLWSAPIEAVFDGSLFDYPPSTCRGRG